MVAQEVLAADPPAIDSEVHESQGSGSDSVKARSEENAPPAAKQESAQVAAPAKKKKKNLRAGVKNAVQLGIFTFVAAFVGAAARGDWMILLVHLLKVYYPDSYQEMLPWLPAPKDKSDAISDKSFWDYMDGVEVMIMMAIAVSFISFFGMSGYLQYEFYIKRKDQAHEWKCQPNKWLTPENERHEILLGSTNMVIGGIISGVIATYILNGGPSQMYFTPTEHGYCYLVVSTVLVFLFVDGSAYYMHRMFHIPFLYRTIHKHHHRYHSPTAFSSSAFHPFEFVIYQSVFGILPIFTVPIYSGAHIMVLLYGYYYGMMHHSGIMHKAFWPWQAETIWHDDHHKYFHTNFGFNTKLWDWMHDTLRQDNRVYGEDVFYGKGKTD